MSHYYFDHMASTPIDGKVLKSMMDIMQSPQYTYNPSEQTIYGQQAQQHFEEAANSILAALQAPDTAEIIWTSGATEASNLAIIGTAQAYGHLAKHILSSTIEHSATLEALNHLKQQGYDIELIPPNQAGIITPSAVADRIRSDTLMLTLHHVNNEIGTIQDIHTIGNICQQHGVLTHFDCAQSIGKQPLILNQIKADYISLSAHKCYGPKGIGALYRSKQPHRKLKPILFGGHQQHNLRPGTASLALVTGMVMCVQEAVNHFEPRQEHIQSLFELFTTHLPHQTLWRGCRERRIPHNINIDVPQLSLEDIKHIRDEYLISAFSACNAQGYSHVLSTLDVAHQSQQRTLRIGLGKDNTTSQCMSLIERINHQARL